MRTHSSTGEQGFSLIETIIATAILAGGLISLAGAYAIGLTHMKSSSPSLIAREKAREAVESVHTARDTGDLSWDKIANVGSYAGVFLTGAQPMYRAGYDGLVNTSDDAVSGLEDIKEAGADSILGTADDVVTPLTDYTRQIEVTDIVNAGVTNPNLRQIRVTIKYKVAGMWRTYQLTTYISRYS